MPSNPPAVLFAKPAGTTSSWSIVPSFDSRNELNARQAISSDDIRIGVTNIHEAKLQLSRLIEQVEAGEEVIIARAEKSPWQSSYPTPPPSGPGT
jgi:hypothetical protein